MVAYPRLRIDIELFIFHSPIIYPFWRTLEIDCPLALFLLLGQNRWGMDTGRGRRIRIPDGADRSNRIAVRSPQLINHDWLGLVLRMVMNALFAIYLLRSATTRFFGVACRARKNSIIVGAAAALIVTVTSQVMYHE